MLDCARHVDLSSPGKRRDGDGESKRAGLFWTESRCVCRRSLCHTGLVDHIKCRSDVRLGLICVCPHHDVLCLTNYSDLSCCSNINCEINHVVWKMPFWCLFSPRWWLYSCRSHFPQSQRISQRNQRRHPAPNESRNWLRRVNKTALHGLSWIFKNASLTLSEWCEAFRRQKPCTRESICRISFVF